MSTLSGTIGFCRKAGKLTVGVHDVVEKLHAGKISAVLISFDTAKNSFEKINRLAEHKGVPVIRTGLSKAEMSRAAGLIREVGVMGIPQEFYEMAIKSL